eukprot:jgi/Mesvir1/11397/Mv10296-RA.1
MAWTRPVMEASLAAIVSVLATLFVGNYKDGPRFDVRAHLTGLLNGGPFDGALKSFLSKPPPSTAGDFERKRAVRSAFFAAVFYAVAYARRGTIIMAMFIPAELVKPLAAGLASLLASFLLDRIDAMGAVDLYGNKLVAAHAFSTALAFYLITFYFVGN